VADSFFSEEWIWSKNGGQGSFMAQVRPRWSFAMKRAHDSTMAAHRRNQPEEPYHHLAGLFGKRRETLRCSAVWFKKGVDHRSPGLKNAAPPPGTLRLPASLETAKA
jgi:hypothetical protein